MKPKSKIYGYNYNLNEVIFLFNTLLADQFLFFTKIRDAKWNLDIQIFGLHQIFEEHTITTHTIVNEVTHQAYALGYFALYADEDHLEINKSHNTGHRQLNRKQETQALLISYGNIINLLRKNMVTVTDKYRELGMSDFITELIEKHEKMAGLLNKYLTLYSANNPNR